MAVAWLLHEMLHVIFNAGAGCCHGSPYGRLHGMHGGSSQGSKQAATQQ